MSLTNTENYRVTFSTVVSVTVVGDQHRALWTYCPIRVAAEKSQTLPCLGEITNHQFNNLETGHSTSLRRLTPQSGILSSDGAIRAHQ